MRFSIDLCDRMKAVWRWSNNRLFQVTSPLSICQSHSREGEGMREHYDWREFLQNNAKSLTFPVPPHPPWRHVRIQCLSQYPKAASRSNNELAPLVLSPVIFTMSCCSASNHSQLSEKIQGGTFYNMERAVASIQFYQRWWPIMAGNKLNQNNALWNHASQWSSQVDALEHES